MPTLTAQQRSNGGKAAAELRRMEKAELAKLREWFRNQATPKPEPETPQQTEAYTQARLTRVRKQLDRLDRMIMTEEDPQKLDRLISASSRLEEQDRKLSGRFTPGTTKPSNKPQSQRRAMPEPVPCGPEPTISSVPSVSSEPCSPKSLEPQQ